MNKQIKTVAILGGGPVACTLAILLKRKGLRPVMYYVPKQTTQQATLIVGESTVPAIVPILQMLGVEDEVRGYSELKPGATVNMGPTQNFHFHFEQIDNGLPRYAYNIPRDRFDATLLDAARKAGVKIVEATAKVEKVADTDKVKLSDESLAAAGNDFSGQPDLIVDATGRIRFLPKLLGIKGVEGGRKDTALFAHVDQSQLDFKGHVHSTRLDHGWSWRIPLPGRVSIGIVIPSEHLPKFGATKEERYDNLLKQDSVLVFGGFARQQQRRPQRCAQFMREPRQKIIFGLARQNHLGSLLDTSLQFIVGLFRRLFGVLQILIETHQFKVFTIQIHKDTNFGF